jgi:flagellar biosynthetic protein FliP
MSLLKNKKFICFTIFLAILIAIKCNYAFAQGINIDFGGEDEQTLFSNKVIQLIGLITILSVAPSILIMVTSFTKITIVFSILRHALGLQQTPPNIVIISLSLFLTFFIMSPTFNKAYDDGLFPLMNNQINEEKAWTNITDPFEKFMKENTREKDLNLFRDIAKETQNLEKDEIPLRVIIPAFMLSELKKAFEIGFLIYLPFLIIDLVVASVLMGMGMMMLPPVIISLPFKLIFFVMIDGWYMLSGSLVKSYGIG